MYSPRFKKLPSRHLTFRGRPWRFHKGPNVRDLQGTNQTIDDLIKKCFLDAIVFVLHNYYCFLLEKQIFKSCKWGRPRDPVPGRPSDQMMGHFGEVRGTSVIYVFKIQLRNILNLLWQFIQDFIVNCGSKTFSEQYGNLNKKN